MTLITWPQAFARRPCEGCLLWFHTIAMRQPSLAVEDHAPEALRKCSDEFCCASSEGSPPTTLDKNDERTARPC